MQSISQRFPMLFVDRIIELEPGKQVTAIKNVTMNEQFFSGHFPDAPIMPGTLIVEAMAQVSTFLFYNPEDPHKKLDFFLGVIKDARFFRPVVPGDKIKIVAQSIRLAEDSAYVKASAVVEDAKVCEAELVFVRRKK
ncbi:MAG: 3-hydroxyacyl-ACP dehydratase FabZ [Candidatus Omnitrophica bacterium]|nr:3-hydroxyacyl-ACP dehydratase FabZ [Candidatus Omnitrophota bacterium]